jgi:hypothetical protein
LPVLAVRETPTRCRKRHDLPFGGLDGKDTLDVREVSITANMLRISALSGM